MEPYFDLVFSNAITPFRMNSKRILALDSFLQSLDDLRDFGAFGVNLSGRHSVFDHIIISLCCTTRISPANM